MSKQPLQHVSVAVAQNTGEKQQIYKFRYRMLVRATGRRDVPGADDVKQMVYDELDERAVHFYADCHGELVGCLRLVAGTEQPPVPEDWQQHYRLNSFVAYPIERLAFVSRMLFDHKVTGAAALHRLMSKVYAWELDNQILFDFRQAAPALVDLYEHLGYRRFADNFADDQEGYRVPMVLAVCDGKHLKKLNSPFWQLLSKKPQLYQDDRTGGFIQETFANMIDPHHPQESEPFWRLMNNRMDRDSQRANLLFHGLDEKEIRWVIEHGVTLQCRAGDPIIRTEDTGNEMFVILKGVVEVRHPETRSQLAVFETGHVVGEVAFVTDMPRSADVIAQADSEIFVFTQNMLALILKRNPLLAAKLLYNLSRILAERLTIVTRRNNGVE